jgi:predicted O-methyltransferase YrrM
LTSAILAQKARTLGARYYACDSNADLVDAMRGSISDDGFVEFRVGDSPMTLSAIAREVDYVDFAFLDGAAFAMKSFREFAVLEPKFRPGSILVMDNAALPGETRPLRSPCRKGKIVVPYLLASPFWEVIGLPEDGDGMVAAIMHEDASFADNA